MQSEIHSNPSQRDAALYPHRRKIKVMTVISLLANTYDPGCCFFQTLIGLTCYSQGLRDKGFRVLKCSGGYNKHILYHGAWYYLGSSS